MNLQEVTMKLLEEESNRDYIEEWKEKELQGYRDAAEYYKTHSNELLDAYEVAENDYRALLDEYSKQHDGETPKRTKVYNGYKYELPEFQEAYNKMNNAHYEWVKFALNENRFFHDNASRSDFDDICRKLIDKHFDQLQAKVENKIGKIIRIENLGGDDYAFEGENGNCKVVVVWAGGYNVQRLHTRWIVKK